MTVMTGPWANRPQKYKDMEDYLTSDPGKSITNYVNRFLQEQNKDLEFTMDADDRQFITDYVNEHGKSSYTINPDGSYDSVRLQNLCVDAIAAKYKI